MCVGVGECVCMFDHLSFCTHLMHYITYCDQNPVIKCGIIPLVQSPNQSLSQMLT